MVHNIRIKCNHNECIPNFTLKKSNHDMVGFSTYNTYDTFISETIKYVRQNYSEEQTMHEKKRN